MVPSLEDVIPLHCFATPVEVTSVQVAPESNEVHIFPGLKSTAASLVKSSEDVILIQFFAAPVEVTSVQVAPSKIQIFPGA